MLPQVSRGQVQARIDHVKGVVSFAEEQPVAIVSMLPRLPEADVCD